MAETVEDVVPLISVETCRSVLEYSESENNFVGFLVTTATGIIERHLGRRIMYRRNVDYLSSLGSNDLFLREYPVRDITSVYFDLTRHFTEETKLFPSQYDFTPDPEGLADVPGTLRIITDETLPLGRKCVKIVYHAGFMNDEIPADLQMAVIELVAWNYARIRTKQVGVKASVTGRDAPDLESSIPENVKQLLEPFRRRTI
jgi:hypothetical protein